MIGRVARSNRKNFYNKKEEGLIECSAFGDELLRFGRDDIFNADGAIEYTHFNADDIVKFTSSICADDGTQRATIIEPIVTMRMIKKALKKDSLYVHNFWKKEYGVKIKYYLVVDENNFTQSPESGMSFDELARYAGFAEEIDRVAEAEKEQDPRFEIVEKILRDFDVKIPLICWSGMSLSELKTCYHDLLIEKKDKEDRAS